MPRPTAALLKHDADDPLAGDQATGRHAFPGLQCPQFIDRDFAHMLAHDLRSPLTAIQMAAEILAERDDPRMRARLAGVVSDQARTIAWGLESLVMLADEEQLQDAPMEPVDLARVLRGAAADLSPLSGSRQVTTTLLTASEPVMVAGVPQALHHAVRCVLHVLVSITPPGGQVTARLMEASPVSPSDDTTLTMLAEAPEAGPGLPVDSSGLPWHRLPLLSVCSLIAQHGGAVEPLGEWVGITLRLAPLHSNCSRIGAAA
ncbi:hypothetical protein LLH03_16225 [bacterium]|nr:hypothetical protein [bacterium]